MKKVTTCAFLCVLIFSLFVSCTQAQSPQETDLTAQTQVILQSEENVDVAQNEQLAQTEEQEQATEVSEQTQEESLQQKPESPETQIEPEIEINEQEIEKNYCTIAIYCDTILDNIEKLDIAKQSIVPQDVVILPPTQIEITQGQSVFDALLEVTRKNNIHMEFSYTPGYDSTYIEGIANLYEFDCGSLSGWIYFVNGEGAGVGCDQYKLNNGDEIQFHYTCQMGQDIKIK